MKTKKLEIRQESDLKDLSSFASLLKSGEVVAFPTETVYGLGADIKSEEGLKKIFKTKGRPSDNPLIVHIAEAGELETIVKEVPEKAKKLAKAFWPGPLTVILEKKDEISPLVTAGLETVAVRLPDNPIARELIKTLGSPIAAPSANISGRPSITRGEDLIAEFDGKAAGLVYGKDPVIGIESTVIDLTGEIPVILRPGHISRDEIAEVIGEVKLSESILTGTVPEKPASPGMKYKHYAPKACVYTFNNRSRALEFLEETKGRAALITLGDKLGVDNEVNFKSLEDYTRKLYSLFREFDRLGFNTVLVEEPETNDRTTGVIDRLRHASNYQRL